MPKPLTGSAETFPSQTSPVAGEPRTAGIVEAAFQNAADRTQYVKDRLDFVDPSRDGARRLRRFADIASLKSSVDYPDGSVALVDGVGIYQFSAASVAPELSPLVLAPTSIGAGAGRWLVVATGLLALGVPNGAAQLNGSGKVPTTNLEAGDTSGRILAASVRNGLVDIQSAYDAAGAQTTSTSFVDLPTPQITVAAKAGDRLEIAAKYALANSASGMSAEAHIGVVQLPGGSPVIVDGSTDTNGELVTRAFASTLLFPISADGNYSVRLRRKVATGAGTVTLSNVSLSSKLFRA